MVAVLACSKSDDKAATDVSTEAPAETSPGGEVAAEAATAPAAAEDKDKAAPPAKPAALNCDDFVTGAMVEERCGAAPSLAASPIIPDDERQCRRSGNAGAGTGNIEVVVTRQSKPEWRTATVQFPPEAVVEERSGGRGRRVKQSAWPFIVSIEVKKGRGRDSGFACTDEQAIALMADVVAKLPTEAGGPAPFQADPRCEDLITADDFKQVCGVEMDDKPTGMANGTSIVCHRVGKGGVVVILTEHRDAATAKSAEGVASGEEGAVAIAKDKLMLEVKAQGSMGDAPACDSAQLEQLAARAAARL
ncbi:MAG: hypothetical protein Tsb0020_50970 [Haliangiales bacterium]